MTPIICRVFFSSIMELLNTLLHFPPAFIDQTGFSSTDVYNIWRPDLTLRALQKTIY